MTIFSKNFLLLIPDYINVLYYKTIKLLIFKYKFKLIYIKLNISYYFTIIYKKLFFKINNNKIKFLNYIKTLLFEISVEIYEKLNLIGIGFKVNLLNNFLTQILMFKLEFSHFIYLKVKSNIKCLCFQYNKIFLINNIQNNIINLICDIRSFKIINKYIGKGIFYYNEILKLKKETKQ